MIDLDDLASLTGLSPESAATLAFRCALALQRRHQPGASLTGDVDGHPIDESLTWRERPQATVDLEDWNRITEEGAEALALALAASRLSWRVKRRLQSRLAEGADWLLVDGDTNTKVVLEVAGTDEGDIGALLKRKLAQAERSPFAERGRFAACVVRFMDPRARLTVVRK